VSQIISAVAATTELAEQLDTETGAPLISLIRESFTSGGDGEKLVDYLHIYYHPDHFQYRMDLELGNK
jgi:DNA-binding GntR family transcriptional regulator